MKLSRFVHTLKTHADFGQAFVFEYFVPHEEESDKEKPEGPRILYFDLETQKTAHGLQAVEWFRQGKMEKLTEYCRHDVEATRDLFQDGLQNGHVIYRKKGVDAASGCWWTGTWNGCSNKNPMMPNNNLKSWEIIGNESL